MLPLKFEMLEKNHFASESMKGLQNLRYKKRVDSDQEEGLNVDQRK